MNRIRPSERDRDSIAAKTRRMILMTLLLSTFGLLIWHGGRWITMPETRTLLVYCFSGMQEVMEEAIFPSFQDRWLTEHGSRVEFVATFAGSGEITKKIVNRFPAEVAILASPMDAARIPAGESGTLPHGGTLARTPLVIAVRNGNPRGIRDFSDLERQGVSIVHPDPLTSGGGQWSLLAVFGSSLRATGSREEAWRRLERIWDNVVARPPSVRAAIERFREGAGDALVVYEAGTVSATRAETPPFQVVHPRSTIVCEPKVLMLHSNIGPKQRDLAERFVRYLWSEAAQAAISEYGFYPVEAGISLKTDRGKIADPFLLADLGGPNPAKVDVIDPFLKQMASVESFK